MAILHHKEEKIQVVLGRLPKEYTHEQFVDMFIKLYSKDWGKIKTAYIKQAQDKEPGTVITMPKPDLYLKQLLANYLTLNTLVKEVTKEKIEITPKVATKKKLAQTEVLVEVAKKPKVVAKKKTEIITENTEPVKKLKATSKKVIASIEEDLTKEIKKKAPVKKKVDTDIAVKPKIKAEKVIKK